MTSSAFRQKFYLAISLVFFLAHGEAMAQNSDVKSAEKKCPVVTRAAPESMFTNLKGIKIYYSISSENYRYALECSKNFEVCAAAIITPPSAMTERNNELKKSIEKFPKPLLPEKIEARLLKKVNLVYQQYVQPDHNCKKNEPKILGLDNYYDEATTVGYVTATVTLEIFDNTVPRIAVLGFNLFRKDGAQSFRGAESNSLPIPLNLSDAEIDARLDDYMETIILPEFYILPEEKLKKASKGPE